jgi:4-amino-4-deoxy-L-arabinose transferase-like glycosyltransferase
LFCFLVSGFWFLQRSALARTLPTSMPCSARFWKIFVLILAGAAVIDFAGAKRVPLWDRDEPWYAQCSREMLQSGDWVVPRYLGELRIQKPPFIYWCQLLSMKVFGETGEAARIPSTVAVLLTALLLGVVTRFFTGHRRALWTTFIFATSGLAIACSKFALTDAVLLLFVFIGQVSLAFIYFATKTNRKPAWWTVPTFWISLGIAGITKGPQVLGMHAVTLLTLLVLDVTSKPNQFRDWRAWKQYLRWWKDLKPVIGVPILVAVVVPWLILVHQREPGFLSALLDRGKTYIAQGSEGHWGPPGFHALLIFGTFFPWSLLLLTAIALAWKNRRVPMIRVAIAATVGPWLTMELIWTKLPLYVLPAFPGLAFLTADALVRCIRHQRRNILDAGFKATLIIWAVATLGLGAAPWLAMKIGDRSDLPVSAFAAFTIAGIVYAALVFVRFIRRQFARGAIILGVGMGVMILILYTTILPNLTPLHLSERLADDLKRLGAYGADINVAMIGYDEPSLAFYQGGGARRHAEFELEMTPLQSWPRWIVISDDEDNWQRLPQRVKDQLIIRAEETGLNYSHEGVVRRVFVVENKLAKPA